MTADPLRRRCYYEVVAADRHLLATFDQLEPARAFACRMRARGVHVELRKITRLVDDDTPAETAS